MKINKYDARASQDITIDELPKQDNPNNSDLVIVQSSSLTEATSIQQLRNKILAGGTSYGEDLGQMLFFTSKTQNPNMHAMDGTIGTKAEYPEFYNFLLTLETLERQFWALDEVNETFFFKNLGDKFIRATSNDGSVKTDGISNSYVVDHSHQVQGSYLDNFWVNPQTGTKPSTARKVLVERVTGDAIQKVGVPVKLGTDNSTISDKNAPSVFFYCYVVVRNLNRADSSLYIKSDGTISMNLDYTPNDINDVATKKYIDNKFLNYPIPLSFSINDIGKRVQYYKNADNNPTLIALDGTKYLIADYPDFDYENQEGFTNDGVYFWFSYIDLEMKTIMKSAVGYDGEFNGYIRFALTEFPVIFNSKLIYNFLQTPQGQPLLVADGAGKDKDNFGFTILNANNFQIRMNTNFYNGNGLGRLIYGGYGMNQVNQKGAINFDSNTSQLPITEGQYLLKIQPDYMVAKIQQVGSVAGAGDLKADRSVLLTGAGVFNSKQVSSMDDLKDSNIIVGNSARVITTLDSKLNQIDTNITTINNNIGSVDITGLQSQTNTNTTDITNIKTVNTSQDSSISNLQNQVNTNTTDITNLQSSIPNFKIAQSRRLVKPNTNIVEIAGQGRLFPIDSFIPTTATGYETDTFIIETFNGKKVIKEKMNNGIVTRHLNIRLSLGHNLTMTTKKIELAVYLFRGSQTGLDDNSAVATGSSMLFYDTDARGQSTNLLSVVVNGVNDSFVTEGWFIVLKSLNPSADKLIFSKGDILINIVNSN